MTTAVAIDRTVIIYALVDPRDGEIRYVGKTADPVARFRTHCWEAMRNCTTAKNRWIWKLLEAGLRPELRVLEEVPADGWQDAERRWIASLRGEGVRLVNGTDGGEGGYPGPEAVARGAAKRRGRTCSSETRQRMSDAKRGVPKSPEHVEAVRLALAGRTDFARQGEANNAKLTNEQVLQIRELRAADVSGVEVARMFGVTPAAVSLIHRRHAWTHL